MPLAEKLELRETVREMIHHTYDGYMRHAFPHDELRPLSQTHTDSLVELGAASPTRRGYSGVALTLIDSLDTLAIAGNVSEFERGVRWVSEHVSFDLDVEVSLFETNIRVLGGLLSAHLLASGRIDGAAHLTVSGYRGELLRLAVDLGERLLSAFDGCAQLPRAFVNLRGHLPRYNAKREQCTAGIGTLLLEFGTLSRLSLDPRFEDAALCALRLLWSKRSKRNLLGNTLDVKTGAWRNPSAGIGAGIDSFYEYALKSYLVFGSGTGELGGELYAIWNASYAAALTHLRVGPWYGESNMYAGRAEAAAFDALQAFWPALQVRPPSAVPSWLLSHAPPPCTPHVPCARQPTTGMAWQRGVTWQHGAACHDHRPSDTLQRHATFHAPARYSGGCAHACPPAVTSVPPIHALIDALRYSRAMCRRRPRRRRLSTASGRASESSPNGTTSAVPRCTHRWRTTPCGRSSPSPRTLSIVRLARTAISPWGPRWCAPSTPSRAPR